MDADSNPNYLELDAASHGLVDDIRQMKEFSEYATTGGGIRIINYDECHMLSRQAQNALLQTLETGKKSLMFLFCTTEAEKMLSTVRSRCVELKMSLLTASQIKSRLEYICYEEHISFDPKALAVIGTYVRGHVRDAVTLLEQVSKVSGKISEKLVREHLRLDSHDEIYQFLCEEDYAEGFKRLENLFCNYAAAELQSIVGRVLLDSYKSHLGIGEFTQVDEAWLKRVYDRYGLDVLSKAERVLITGMAFSSIDRAVAIFGRIFFQGPDTAILPSRKTATSSIPEGFRKPK
jgi:DNA polymerase-3 subunit gamma/tau